MAMVVHAPGGGGGVRLIFSALLRRLLGFPSSRIATSSPSGSPFSDDDDDTSPLIKRIPRNISSVSNFFSLDGRDSSSAHMSGAMPLSFGHPDWPAHQLFDVRTQNCMAGERHKQDLEMVTSTRRVTRLPREHEHVIPPVTLVNTTPGQPPILRIPLTDRLVASFLAQAVGVQVDGTDGVNMTANRPVIPPSSNSKSVGLQVDGTDGVNMTPNRAVIPPSSDSKGGPTQLMKVFRGLLLAHVFFALPLIVIFFPRDDKESKNALLSLFDRKEVSTEKMVVLALFVIHASLGSLGVLLAHIADGPVCTGIVGSLTLWIIISVVGFIDYIFLKTLPDEGNYRLVFLVHFIVMLLVICGLWAKFVGFSQCCCSKQDQS